MKGPGRGQVGARWGPGPVGVKKQKACLFSGGKKIKDEIFLRKLLGEEIGIFESLRTYRGKIFREGEHLKRFLESTKTAGLQDSLRPEDIRKELRLALRALGREGDVFIRLTLLDGRIFVMIGNKEHPKKFYEKGISLFTSPVPRVHSNASPPEAKTNAYQNALLATLEPKPHDITEWLFLDQNGFVTEVRIGNIFMVRSVGARPASPAGGRAVPLLLTPPPIGILNGVTRRFVIKCAASAGFLVQEEPLTRHDFYNAEEVFLTNTSWEILPVCEIDRRKIGSGIPGPATKKLHSLFKKRALTECS